MKTIIRLIVAVSFLTLFSCSKNLSKENTVKIISDFPTIEVACDVDTPTVNPNDDSETKVYGTEGTGADKGKFTIKWKEGDAFSMVGVVTSNNAAEAQGTVINWSNLSQTLKNGDGTKTFHMTVPNLQEIYGASSGVTVNEFCIWPATQLSVYPNPNPVNSVVGYPHYVAVPVTPLTIPDHQDGTGWPYSIWFSRSAALTATYNNPVGGGMKFFLASTLLHLKINSGKNITQIVLSNERGFLSGDVTKIDLNYMTTTSTANFSIAEGCPGTSVTIENGGVLPDDIMISIRDLREGAAGTGGHKFTFTFTAEDGSTATKTFTNPVGYSNRQFKKIVSLGVVTIADGDWIPAA